MVKKWFSKGTDKNGKKMVKTFFLATKLCTDERIQAKNPHSCTGEVMLLMFLWKPIMPQGSRTKSTISTIKRPYY